MKKQLTRRITFRITKGHLKMLDVLQKNLLPDHNRSEIMRIIIETLYQQFSGQTTNEMGDSGKKYSKQVLG